MASLSKVLSEGKTRLIGSVYAPRSEEIWVNGVDPGGLDGGRNVFNEGMESEGRRKR